MMRSGGDICILHAEDLRQKNFAKTLPVRGQSSFRCQHCRLSPRAVWDNGLVMLEFLQHLLWGAAAFAEDEDTVIRICSELWKNSELEIHWGDAQVPEGKPVLAGRGACGG